MSRSEARNLINSQGRAHTVVVYFTKRNGEMRRMVCRYFGAPSRKPYLMAVWDIEKGAVRSVNLDTVQSVKVLTSEAQPTPERTFEDVQAEMDELFY